ncbi:ABC transporter periplasmic binding domain protein [Acididesulfobacillus acetoxydans]|uniref:ABC transporter periplasmic binding domain protein n=1 Tax=Acididesulfobacillus acetoxydans TaxID=1561005 RepID=A0A8S0VYQ6_9FIRM|nr:ABC transporter substrate-binding protein [Acididesulfobacillus acetoxydans]CAA7603283.1 ABC transporter periplasmic binding domain protein [Acididesulfobacillus acetoxydans]
MKKKENYSILCVALVVLLILVLTGCSRNGSFAANSQVSATHHTITDMAGRHVTVPKNVQHILALHPVATYLLWRLAPNKLVSVDKLFNQEYLKPGSMQCFSAADVAKLRKLPVTGVFFSGVDPEQIITLNPDVVITIVRHPKLNQFANQIGKPVICFAKDALQDYPPSIRMIGQIVGNETEANKLADYWVNTLQSVKNIASKIPQSQKLRVYYANKEILTTPDPQSIMASIIDTAGGLNVGDSLPGSNNENTPVSMEQVIKWNPQVILTGSEAEKQQIMTGPGWQCISAVKNNRVYVRPRYGNTDGISAIMGLVWTQDILLHPNNMTSFDRQMKQFYQLFFNYQITPAEINEVVQQ